MTRRSTSRLATVGVVAALGIVLLAGPPAAAGVAPADLCKEKKAKETGKKVYGLLKAFGTNGFWHSDSSSAAAFSSLPRSACVNPGDVPCDLRFPGAARPTVAGQRSGSALATARGARLNRDAASPRRTT